MSARQRHSRVTTDDGWTTISSSHKQQKKSKSKKNGNKTSSTSNGGPNYLPAILAHKSDLDFGSQKDGGNAEDEEVTDQELASAKKRLQKQIDTFNESSCCQKVKELIREKLGNPEVASHTGASVTNVLILALGKISSSFFLAPGYQLAAALVLVEVLRELHKMSMPSSQSEPDGVRKEEHEVDPFQVFSYDPVYTSLDRRLLENHSVKPIPASEIPSLPSSPSPSAGWETTPPSTPAQQPKKSWYTSSLVYMPHASIWLNHKYLMTKPKVWIGNTFDVYERAVMDSLDDQRARGEEETGEKSEIAVMIEDIKKLIEEYEYERLEWPEAEWGGGAVFNSTVVYVRRRDGRVIEDNQNTSLAESVKKLKI